MKNVNKKEYKKPEVTELSSIDTNAAKGSDNDESGPKTMKKTGQS